MGIIIGAATTATMGGVDCIISANWSTSQNEEKVYCLGEWVPSFVIKKPQQTLSLTLYSPGPTYDTQPTTTCANANTIAASVSPVACGANIEGASGQWYVTGYGYDKSDKQMPGQESWSMMQYLGDANIQPTYNLRGMATGNYSGDNRSSCGIIFSSEEESGTSGSVSANQMGTADVNYTGDVTQVGGGTATVGIIAKGDASIAYIPLFI